MRRYEIQVCYLDFAIRKSKVEWVMVNKAWSLNGARLRAQEIENISTFGAVARVIDTKTGKVVA